jgi:hypothetical protein
LQPPQPPGPGWQPQQESLLEDDDRNVDPHLNAKRLRTFEAFSLLHRGQAMMSSLE